MTDIDNLAVALFGSKRAETQEVLTDATTRTYVGTALTDSKDGTVMVDLGGDVTLPDDVEGIAEYSADGVEVSTGPGVRAGDEVVVTLVGGTPLKTPMVTGVAGEGDRQDERIHAIEADYVKASTLEADVADIGFLKADSAAIKDLQADTAKVHDLTADQLSAATAYIASLNAKSVTAETLAADVAKVHDLTADQLSAAAAYIAQLSADSVTAQRIAAISGDFDTVRANAAKVANLTAAQLEADHATIGTLDTTYATIANLNATNGRITNLESTKANISDLEADYIKADEIEATYMHANMSNSDVAWISNGTIKDGAITNAMINSVSANKLTAGTIDASDITVTNLNADNITTGTINGQRIGEGSLSLDKLSESVYTEAEVNNIVDGLNDRIDGAIETFTGTAVPTLNNQPASSWKTTKLRDEHVGDVYYVVNSQSQQNGYCYRFTKSGSTYSWQLIKDSDVTAALSRLTTAEGKITTFDSDISKLKTDTGTLTTKTESLETRMSDAESDILDKVDTTTFNEVSDTVDSHSQSITQMTTTLSNKADNSTVTAVTNRVSKNEQDISGINTTIGELQETVESKADGSTVSTISNKLNTVSDTVDGHTQTLTSVQNTLSTKADSSTVTTLSTKVNNVSDTVDGHTSQLTSITTTQTTMQGTLDKTVKSSIQLWYSKANTTAPSKPTSKVTSTSTAGNAWRIVVPAYNSSYPHYFYCWQYEYVDGTYGWSAVVRDIAMGESQSTARTADSNASAAVTTANTANTNASTALTTANTANTNASDAKTAATTASTTASEAKTTAETAASDASTAKTNAASAVTTANSANTKATNAQTTANANIKSSVQLWFTKANSTAPNKPTSVVSTSNANTANAWNLIVPVWNKSYQHYFYCYQQQKGDGNYQWTDVVYDRATSEAQQLANTTSTNLSTLQTNYATFKQQTEQFESTVGTTYATKTELKGATDDITELEGRVSTNETSIRQNSDAIALRATKTEAEQMAQPNLSPFFSQYKSDVYSSANPDGYWHQSSADGFPSLISVWDFEQETVNGSGWAHFVANNTATVTLYACAYIHKNALQLKPSTKYTFLVEWLDVSSTGGTPVLYTTTQHGGTNGDNNDYFTTTTSISLTSGSGSKYISATTRNTLDSGCNNRIRAHIWIGTGISTSGYIRISLYEGEYAGPYKPYSGTQLYASQAELKVQSDRIGMVVSNSDASSSLQLTPAAITAVTDNLTIKNSSGTATVISGGKIQANSLTIGDMNADTQADILNNNMVIGGRNLLFLTRDFETKSGSTTGGYLSGASLGTRVPIVSETYKGLAVRHFMTSDIGTSTYYDLVYNSLLNPISGKSYVFSFYAKGTGKVRTHLYPNVSGGTYKNTGSQGQSNTATDGAVDFTVSSDWQRFWVCFEIGGTQGTNARHALLRVFGGNDIFVCGLKFEEGNKATDWTPAPEDITVEKYITSIDDNGIRVHAKSNTTTNYAKIDADGMDVVKGGVSVAQFGEDSRIGREDQTHVSISATETDTEATSEIGLYESTGTTPDLRLYNTTRTVSTGAGDLTLTEVGIELGQEGALSDGATIRSDIQPLGTTVLMTVGSKTGERDSDANVTSVNAKGTAEVATHVNGWSDGGATATLSATQTDGGNAYVEVHADAESTSVKVVGEGINVWDGDSTHAAHGAFPTCGVVNANQSTGTPANSYQDFTVDFNHTYSAAPHVVVGFYSTSTASALGGLSCAVNSITTTGCKVRVFNSTSAARSPAVEWIAIG